MDLYIIMMAIVHHSTNHCLYDLDLLKSLVSNFGNVVAWLFEPDVFLTNRLL